ncbi:MAG TPA: histidinol dehydrogenase [Vicinamibacterales bacterium]|nr:histidinol dehydrogenase [Vicinamibacterales bacterium]
MKIVDSTNRRAVAALLSATRIRDRATERRAATIVERVRRGGDSALRTFARDFDGLTAGIEVPRSTWEKEARALPPAVQAAIRKAARHIRSVARRQAPSGWRHQVAAGITVEQRVIPLSRVGCYVPAGRYPLPSSLLMTAVPARAAGVTEVVVCCPRPDAAVFAAAIEAGVDRLFRIGGAHAVAALAYGTRTVPRVDKIVGPGNRWVSAAKSLVSSDCGIDFYAGPTEILIVTNSGSAGWIAADLLAQAEHDPDARAVMITTSRRLADRVAVEVERQMPATGPARAAIARHGGIVVCRSMKEAVDLANDAAAEHVVAGTEAIARRILNGGAVFVGDWSAQVAGDYAIGSNHVLPTAGAARYRGGLNAADFVKLVSVQRVTRRGLKTIAKTITTLARAEGLEQHAQSIEIRSGRAAF